MKKLIITIFCFLITVVISVGTVSAASDEGVLKLPEDDGTGYPVTGVSDSYSNDDEVTKVIIPENIVRIDDKTFYGCSNLNQIRTHDKIQRIGADAFFGTAYYKDQDNWNNGVLYIGDCLIKADPDKISSTYTVRNGTRLIADEAFKDCENLTSIEFPETVQYVGKDAFIGTELFNNKENWTDNSLLIGHVLISFDKEYEGVFSLPTTVATIADGAFEHSKVTEIITLDSLKYIGQDAFWDSQNLKSISLGASVKTLGRGPFRMCDNLEKITVDSRNENFAVVDGVLYNKQLSAVIRCPEKLSGTVTLPASVYKINAYAFEWCTEIEGVVIPEGCLFIGNSAFSVCENLSDINIPETMEYIDHYAFSYCNSIESMNICDNVTYLGRYVFTCCMNLKDITIGNGLIELKEGLFESCEKLANVSLGENLEEINESAFANTKYVSDVSNYEYGLLISSDKYLIKVAQDVSSCYIPSGITLVADGAFEKLSESYLLEDVHVPASLKKFNWGAFRDVPSGVPVHFDGTIHKFIDITDVDWDCINLYTKDYSSTIWSVVITTLITLAFTIGILTFNYVKKKHVVEETEDEYEQ